MPIEQILYLSAIFNYQYYTQEQVTIEQILYLSAIFITNITHKNK
jgi:hypothetical protein